MCWRTKTTKSLQRSKETIETRLKEFNYEIRTTAIRTPSPTHHPGKPNFYPGRLWRLEWGEMEEPLFTPNGTLTSEGSRNDSVGKVTYSIIGPGISAAKSPSYKTYF